MFTLSIAAGQRAAQQGQRRSKIALALLYTFKDNKNECEIHSKVIVSQGNLDYRMRVQRKIKRERI